MSNLLARIHEWLICLVVGKRPVMMNMNLEAEEYIKFNVADGTRALIINSRIDIIYKWPILITNTTNEVE